MTDTALLDKWVRERDAEAFRQLASRYSALVYATCVRVLRDPIEAEDAAQECFEALARTDRAVGPYLGAWLHRVATNRCRDRIKTEVRRRARENLHAVAHTAEPDPGWDEIHALVDEALNETPEKYRAPLVAHFLENQSHDAVARILGVPRATVTHRIKKGLELVRRSLVKKGVAVGAPVLAAAFGSLHATAASVPVELEAALGRIAVAGVSAGSAFGTNAREIVRTLGPPLAKTVLVAVAVLALGFCLMGRRVLSPALNPVETFQIRASVASEQETQTHAPNSESIGVLAAPGPANGEAAHTGGTEGDTISGRVYDAKTGEGIAGASVYMMALDGTNTPGRPLRTGSDGGFRANGVKAGAYKFFCNSSGSSKYPTSVSSPYVQATVDPGQSVDDVDFAFEAGIPISGIVYDRGGKPASRANVRAEAISSRVQEYASTSEDGTFTVYYPAPEPKVQLSAKSGDFVSYPGGALSLPAEGLKNITLTLSLSRTAALEGVVVQRDGRPAASYTVDSQRESWSNHCTTNADGTFSLKRLVPGVHTVTAWRGDWRAWNLKESGVEFVLEEGKTLSGVTLVAPAAQETHAISGRVTDSSGHAIVAASVDAYDRFSCGGRAESDENGAFKIENLDRGEYQVSASGGPPTAPYSLTQMTTIEAGRDDLTIILKRPGRIEGRVVGSSEGQPVSKFDVCYSTGEARGFESKSFDSWQSVRDRDGRFTLENVAPGPVEVTVLAPGYALTSRFASVYEKQTVSGFEIRLDPGAILDGKVVNASDDPIAGAEICFGPHDIEARPRGAKTATRTGPDGTFSFASLSPSIATVYVYHPGYSPIAVDVHDAAKIVMVEESSIVGAVSAAGKPLDGMILDVTTPWLTRHSTISERDGTYRVNQLGAGVVTVTATAHGHSQLSREVNLSQGQSAKVDFDVSSTDHDAAAN